MGETIRPALLVTDLQRWFLEVGPPEKLARVGTLVARANELIDFFHDEKLPVFHVRTVHKADGSTWNQWMKEHKTGRLLEGTREAEGHPDVHTHDADVVLHKTRHSAFIRTELERVLRGRGVDTIVIAGFSTNACVGLTAIEAWERDFGLILAEEAILGTNLDEAASMLNYLRTRFEIEPVSNAKIMRTVSAHLSH